MESSDNSLDGINVSHDTYEEGKLTKLKIKILKDENGIIIHGKIVGEINEEWKNQLLPVETSVENDKLPMDPNDSFHRFPDWVCDNFTGWISSLNLK